MTSVLDSLVESDVSETSDVSVEKPKLNLREIVNTPSKQESKFWKYEELPDKDESEIKKPRGKRIVRILVRFKSLEHIKVDKRLTVILASRITQPARHRRIHGGVPVR